jgi:hypothetical protein
MAYEVELTLHGEGNELFVYLPTALRNRGEILVGHQIFCRVLEADDGRGEGSWWEVRGYWHELHPPPELRGRLGMRAGQRVRLRLERLRQWETEREIGAHWEAIGGMGAEKR